MRSTSATHASNCGSRSRSITPSRGGASPQPEGQDAGSGEAVAGRSEAGGGEGSAGSGSSFAKTAPFASFQSPSISALSANSLSPDGAAGCADVRSDGRAAAPLGGVEPFRSLYRPAGPAGPSVGQGGSSEGGDEDAEGSKGGGETERDGANEAEGPDGEAGAEVAEDPGAGEGSGGDAGSKGGGENEPDDSNRGAASSVSRGASFQDAGPEARAGSAAGLAKPSASWVARPGRPASARPRVA